MPEEISFQDFLNTKLKDRGLSLKKLSELTGIAVKHLENMSRGDFSQLPPSPYFHGYLLKLGEVLDFDPNPWWERLRQNTPLKTSGEKDALPKNRFARVSHRHIIFPAAVGALILIFVLLRLPAILGKPEITVTFPRDNPATVSTETIVLAGTLSRADSLTIGGGENIPIEPDGSWQKSVLLLPGPNNFQIRAKKTLGRETEVVQQIFYEAPQLPPEPPATQ